MMMRKIPRMAAGLLFISLFLVFLSCSTGSGGDDGDTGGGLPTFGSSGWNDLGILSIDYSYEGAIAIDPADDKPVIIISSESEGYKAHIFKYASGTGTSAVWADLGFASSGNAGWVQVMALSDGTAVAAFRDNANSSRAHVLKYVSGSGADAVWSDLGFVSADEARYLCLERCPVDGKPVLGFTEYSGGYRKARVAKWSSGTNWTDYGTPSVKDGLYFNMALSPTDGTPYVSFQDGNNADKALVMKWAGGTSWTSLGVPSAGAVEDTDLVVDSTDEKPVVVYKNTYAFVWKWTSGVTWGEPLGIISTGEAGQTKLEADRINGKPVAAFIDYDISEKLHVLRYNTNEVWVDFGSPRDERVGGFDMAVDKFGRIFVVFTETLESYTPRIFMYMD